MNPEKDIEVQLEELAKTVTSKDSFVQDVMSRIETSSDKPQKQSIHISFIRRIFMKTSVKFAAAAIVLIAAFLSLTLFNKTVAQAYALEQTIQALHSVRCIHMRQINPQHENEPILVWAEFFENGLPKRIRLNLPEWSEGGKDGDGAKEIVWENNIATAWLKKKNLLLRIPEKKIADRILKIVQEQDPKKVVQHLLDAQKKGKFEIQIEQPSDKAEPIRVTAIHLPGRASKLVVSVDQATQLPLSGETYTLKDGDYILTNIGEFYDYNQPIDPAMFTLDNVPKDVMRINQITNDGVAPEGHQEDRWYIKPGNMIEVHSTINVTKEPMCLPKIEMTLPIKNAVLVSATIGKNNLPFENTAPAYFRLFPDGQWFENGEHIINLAWKFSLKELKSTDYGYEIPLQSLIPVTSYKLHVTLEPGCGYVSKHKPELRTFVPFSWSDSISKTRFGTCGLTIKPE